jgi:hypothetical protein
MNWPLRLITCPIILIEAVVSWIKGLGKSGNEFAKPGAGREYFVHSR